MTDELRDARGIPFSWLRERQAPSISSGQARGSTVADGVLGGHSAERALGENFRRHKSEARFADGVLGGRPTILEASDSPSASPSPDGAPTPPLGAVVAQEGSQGPSATRGEPSAGAVSCPTGKVPVSPREWGPLEGDKERPRPRLRPEEVPWASIPGEGAGRTWPSCGRARFGVACARGARARRDGQQTLDDGHDVEIANDHCDRPRCACLYCVLTWRDRAARRAAERLQAFEDAIRAKKGQVGQVKHVVVSLPDDESRRWIAEGPDAIYARLLPRVWRRLEEAGMYAAAIIVHHVRSEEKAEAGARRYHIGKNYVSLHVHVHGYGFLEDARKFHARTGWLYKNKGQRRDIVGSISYNLDHAMLVEGRHALRYFGGIAYNQLKLVSETKISEVRRCRCGEMMERYELAPGREEPDWAWAHGYVYRVRRTRLFEWRPPDWLLKAKPPDPGGAAA